MRTQNLLITRLRFTILIATCLTYAGCGLTPPGVLVVGMHTSPKIDLNTATVEQLMTLPGVSEIKANRIIQGRPYYHVADLWRVKGIGRKTMDGIRDKITVANAQSMKP